MIGAFLQRGFEISDSLVITASVSIPENIEIIKGGKVKI
jgi:hypothetical protein